MEMEACFMKKTYLFVAVAVMAVLMVMGSRVVAQLILPATEPGGEQTAESQPSYVSGDAGYINTLPPDDNPDGLNSIPEVLFSYNLVSGATLRGRSSITQYTYAGSGCAYTTVGDGTQRILNTDLHLPNHAVIKYLRIYYNDTNANKGVDGFITRYTPGETDVKDLVAASPPDYLSNGFGYTVSPEITETVNNELYAYTLIAYPDENNANIQVCGLRVAYFPPYNGIVFLPAVQR
jgi:hypothetical protein